MEQMRLQQQRPNNNLAVLLDRIACHASETFARRPRAPAYDGFKSNVSVGPRCYNTLTYRR